MTTLPSVDPLEEPAMRPALKLLVIGGEVTMLAAFTGVGIHLALQPHRTAFRPPPLALPSGRAPVLPSAGAPALPAATAATGTRPGFGPELFSRVGQQDRRLLTEQWDLLRRLTRAIERYVEDRLTQQMHMKA
jgi:hypothetical protein